MIQISNLAYAYRRGSNPVFTDINLSLEKGKIYGLLGRNGVGKSTLLYNILGLQTPTTGSVLFNDTPSHLRQPQMLRECYAVTELIDLPSYSLKKYIDIHSPFFPRFSATEFYNYLDVFNMPHSIKNLTRLSMGEQKKIYISFALACNTSFLVMDEPTNGLDIPAKAEFRKAISLAMTDDKCIIISTHQVSDIETLLDNVILMANSGIILSQSIAHIGSLLSFGENAPDALFSQPFLGGNYTISPNTTDTETSVRLELLFNALHSENKSQILNILNNNEN